MPSAAWRWPSPGATANCVGANGPRGAEVLVWLAALGSEPCLPLALWRGAGVQAGASCCAGTGTVLPSLGCLAAFSAQWVIPPRDTEWGRMIASAAGSWSC